MGRWLTVLALLLLTGCNGRQETTDGVRVGEALGGGAVTEGYARARGPRDFRFPRDHGPHPDYRNEWWYVTGNLTGEDGDRYGFQLTLFRIAIRPEPMHRPSDWATRQVYMGHFAVTDAARERFLAFERFSRAAIGLAGAESSPPRVWLEDWRLEAEPGETFPSRLHAAADGTRLTLNLRPRKGPVLQGDAGLSQKSAEPGNASYYYSMPRLAAKGQLEIDGRRLRVEGDAWLDREWSTSALGQGQAGWDWFALQFDDGTELMYYRLRRDDGTVDPHSAGTFIAADGTAIHIAADEAKAEPLRWWESPEGGRYPVEWRLNIPRLDLDLTARPLLDDQELDLTVRYWEGAMVVEGSHEGRSVAGRGYLEMTGYGDSATGMTGR